MKTLIDNFKVTNASVKPAKGDISKEDYLRAALEYISAMNASKFKIGDLLNSFREEFGSSEVQGYLIAALCSKTELKKATLENAMSLAKHFEPDERTNSIFPTIYHLLQSLKDKAERSRLLSWYLQENAQGSSISQVEFQKAVRNAKIKTGQGVGKQGNASRKRE